MNGLMCEVIDDIVFDLTQAENKQTNKQRNKNIEY